MKQMMRLLGALGVALLLLVSAGCEYNTTTEYDLTVTVNGSGSVSPSSGTYDEDTTVTLRATPASGWVFTGWSGDAGGTSTTINVVMDSDKSVVANFSQNSVGDQYTLSVWTSGSGSVSSTGGTYDEGTTVTLTATAASGWEFAGWSGDAGGTSRTIQVVMNSDKSVVANFSETSTSGTTMTYEAESALVGNGVVESEHSGYSGSGYVNYANATGSYVTWTVYTSDSGYCDVTIRYANGSSASRPMDISVDGSTQVSGQAFYATGAWTSWDELTVTLYLNEGANYITATATGSDGGPNVDKIDVYGDVIPTPEIEYSGIYVAPNGNDNNAGTIDAPFKSITRAQSVASSGDTVFLRGGTYSNFTIAGSDANYNFVHNITKSGITYEAYPGETPVFNFSGTTTAKRVAAFHIANGVTVTFIGFTVTGVPVGSQKQSECFRIEGNATFERMTCRDNQANGFYFTLNASGYCLDCDSYNNVGVTGTSAGNTDGFGAHCKGKVTFRGCRAWNCSDDGFDCIATYSTVRFEYCWVYNINGTGDGNGFKIGGWGTATPPSSPPSHVVQNCLAANIKNSGFYANHHPGKAADWTYNTAYNCGSDFNMLERVSPTNATDIPGTREVLHYNIAYAGTIISNSNLPAANVTNNSWTKSVTVNSSDFQSLDASQMTRARKSDGTLPDITFMKLTSGSDLAGLGY